jgi:hypothetical protein
MLESNTGSSSGKGLKQCSSAVLAGVVHHHGLCGVGECTVLHDGTAAAAAAAGKVKQCDSAILVGVVQHHGLCGVGESAVLHESCSTMYQQQQQQRRGSRSVDAQFKESQKLEV